MVLRNLSLNHRKFYDETLYSVSFHMDLNYKKVMHINNRTHIPNNDISSVKLENVMHIY